METAQRTGPRTRSQTGAAGAVQEVYDAAVGVRRRGSTASKQAHLLPALPDAPPPQSGQGPSVMSALQMLISAFRSCPDSVTHSPQPPQREPGPEPSSPGVSIDISEEFGAGRRTGPTARGSNNSHSSSGSSSANRNSPADTAAGADSQGAARAPTAQLLSKEPAIQHQRQQLATALEQGLRIIQQQQQQLQRAAEQRLREASEQQSAALCVSYEARTEALLQAQQQQHREQCITLQQQVAAHMQQLQQQWAQHEPHQQQPAVGELAELRHGLAALQQQCAALQQQQQQQQEPHNRSDSEQQQPSHATLAVAALRAELAILRQRCSTLEDQQQQQHQQQQCPCATAVAALQESVTALQLQCAALHEQQQRQQLPQPVPQPATQEAVDALHQELATLQQQFATLQQQQQQASSDELALREREQSLRTSLEEVEALTQLTFGETARLSKECAALYVLHSQNREALQRHAASLRQVGEVATQSQAALRVQQPRVEHLEQTVCGKKAGLSASVRSLEAASTKHNDQLRQLAQRATAAETQLKELQARPLLAPPAARQQQDARDSADSHSAAPQQSGPRCAPQQRPQQGMPVDTAADAAAAAAAAAATAAAATAAAHAELQQQVQACQNQLSALSRVPLTTHEEAAAVRTALDRGANAHMELGQVREQLGKLGTEVKAAQQQLCEQQVHLQRLQQQQQGCHIAVKTRQPHTRAELRAILCNASGVDPTDLQGFALLSNSPGSAAEVALQLVRSQQGAPAPPQPQQQRTVQQGLMPGMEGRRQQQAREQQRQQPWSGPPGMPPPPLPAPQQQRQQQDQPAAPPGLAPMAQQYPPPPPSPVQQPRQPDRQRERPGPLIVYRLKVASPEVAERLVSAATKNQLKQAGTAVFVEPWLTPSQMSARRNLSGFIATLKAKGTSWRWSQAHPTQLEQKVRVSEGDWRWQLAFPPPPSN